MHANRISFTVMLWAAGIFVFAWTGSAPAHANKRGDGAEQVPAHTNSGGGGGGSSTENSDQPQEYLPPDSIPPDSYADSEGNVWCDDGAGVFICGFTDPMEDEFPDNREIDPDIPEGAAPPIGRLQSINPPQDAEDKDRKKLAEKAKKLEEEAAKNKSAQAESKANAEAQMSRMKNALDAMKRGAAGDFPDRVKNRDPRQTIAAKQMTPNPRAAHAKNLSIANPRTREDIALAQSSGYGHVFKNTGISVAHKPGGFAEFVRKDGRRATDAQVSALRAAILSEPAVLAKQPAFFNTIPRSRYDALKSAFISDPGREGTFLHVGLNEGRRDFQWEKSCSRVSEECNPHSTKPSYKKGAFIEAESLENMWEDIFREQDENDARRDNNAGHEVAQEKLSRRSGLSSLGAILKNLGSTAKNFFTGNAGAHAETAVLASALGPVSTHAKGAPLAGSAARRSLQSPVPGKTPSDSNTDGNPNTAAAMFWLIVAAGLALLTLGVARRNRDGK